MEPNTSKNLEENNNNQLKQSTWDGDKVMSIAAIFISILSMLAITYQSYLAREENEMMRIQQSASVLPYLSHWYSDIEHSYKFTIANKGVGPAFIKEVKFIAFDPESKEKLFFTKDSNYFMDFIREKSDLLDFSTKQRNPIYTNKLISPNEVLDLVIFSPTDSIEVQQIEDEFNKFYAGFIIVYEDVYGTRWRLTSNQIAPEKLEKN